MALLWAKIKTGLKKNKKPSTIKRNHKSEENSSSQLVSQRKASYPCGAKNSHRSILKADKNQTQAFPKRCSSCGNDSKGHSALTAKNVGISMLELEVNVKNLL